MSRHYPKPTKWYPKHPEKYVGDCSAIIVRSSWEKDFLRYCDEHPSVIRYSSEEIVVPYVSPLDNKVHRYFPDVVLEVKKKDGEIVKMMVEIKPHGQTILPTSKNRKRLEEQVATYVVNKAKWDAAEAFCQKHGMIFKILTERELYK